MGDVRIRVVQGDALDHPSDVLVLKYAQASHGVDAKAAKLTGINSRLLPPPGGSRVVIDPPALPVHALIFIGVVALPEFGYREIREFARRALATVAGRVGDAREIAMTVHGAGYGLDEIEAFDAQLAGIFEALANNDLPSSLECVTILEIGPGRAQRLSARLESELHDDAVVPRGPSATAAVGQASAERMRTVGYDSVSRGHALVAMPFDDDDFDDVFYLGIFPAVRDSGLLCERVDKDAFTGDVVEHLKRRIQSARLVVAELTGSNPNVYLEVGFAWGCGVPTVLLRRKNAHVEFDVQGHKFLVYKNIVQLKEQLSNELAVLYGR